MLLNDILSGINMVFLLTLAWVAREWWKAHKEQHREFAEAIERLKETFQEGFASKHAVERAHARIDEVEARTIDHDLRLVNLEAHMGAEPGPQGLRHKRGR